MIMIIDQHLVVGGSANYTNAAETRNAENVLFFDSADIAGRFLDNWGPGGTRLSDTLWRNDASPLIGLHPVWATSRRMDAPRRHE